ncbi:MAG: MlaA family lipoprotein [Limnohabitans sp.]
MVRHVLRLLVLLAVLAQVACATQSPPHPYDPFETTNRRINNFNESVDAKVLRPVAVGYKNHVPGFIQTGVNNFFGNLKDIWSTLNNGLQAKPMETAETGLRVAVNSVFGIYGLFDVATLAGIQRHNADFGQTLGYWGMSPGPYVILPLLGPSTVRDTAGWAIDNRYDLWRTEVDAVGLRYGGSALRLVDKRAGFVGMDTSLNEVALDKYTFVRDAYLQRRLAATRRKSADKDNGGDDGDDGM